MSSPQSPSEAANTEAGTRNTTGIDNSTEPVSSQPAADESPISNENDQSSHGPKISNPVLSRDTKGSMEADPDAYAEDHDRDSSSSTSVPGSADSFDDPDGADGADDDGYGYTHDHEHTDAYIEELDAKSFKPKSKRNGRDIRSARTSLSSLPGSIVINPSGRYTGGGDSYLATAEHYGQHMSGYGNNGMMDAANSTVRSKKDRHKEGRIYNSVPQLRDRDSPFRHPSSVRAMQMGDEYDDDEDGDFIPRRARRAHNQHRESGVSYRSLAMSSTDKRPYPTQSPCAPQVKKEYPLVLLHCSLLPPSLPLFLPPGSPAPDRKILQEVLPEIYWKRWKMLEDKIGASSVLRERGVLISHPQEAYDLLEERLLESLELIRPRLAYGHFLGGEDGEVDGKDNNLTESHMADSTMDNDENSARENCLDCGQKMVGNPESVEKKWEIRVYAANGLMRAGAWAAAWREMEKIDIEVGVWLPADIKRELERRTNQRETTQEDKPPREERCEIHVAPTQHAPSQDQIDGLEDLGFHGAPAKQPAPNPPASQMEVPAPPRYSADEINLQAALFNYLRMLFRDRQVPIVTCLLVLVALIMPSPYSTTSSSLAPNPNVQPFTTTVLAQPYIPSTPSIDIGIPTVLSSSETVLSIASPIMPSMPTAISSSAIVAEEEKTAASAEAPIANADPSVEFESASFSASSASSSFEPELTETATMRAKEHTPAVSVEKYTPALQPSLQPQEPEQQELLKDEY
ncbi:hypothetical protein FQN57_001803 [Myotisia sp. PD_48]|nr:hypothetical protein FQN57_001803 [Myotisia sp. PD_48]